MMKKIIIKAQVIMVVMLTAGCSNWLDVQPYDKISEKDLLKNETGYQELLNGIYIELCSDELYGKTMTVEMLEILGGAYEIGSDVNVWGNYVDLKTYKFNTDYWRSRLSSTWNKAYSLILNCNKILDNIDDDKDLFQGDNYNIIRGEAMALRAMLHFDMLRLFGPVFSLDPDASAIPYYTTVSTEPQPALTAREVIEKVINDLTAARSALLNDPVITDGTLMESSESGSSNFLRYRPLRLNYYAVTALLARVELYGGNKTEALKAAVEVIRAANKGIFPFVDRSLVVGSPSDPDRIFSSEVIFSLSTTMRNNIFLDYFSPTRTTYTFKMENALITQVIYGGGTTTGGYQDDYRNRACWSSSGTNKYFYKYADMVETGKIQNTMIPLIRLGEMYLIAAESQSATLANGVSYVNTLRSNRGISTSLPTLDRRLLEYEYIRELYGEGQLFFMYKRMYEPVIWSANDNKNPSADRNIFVVPLPDSETENIQ